MKPVGGHNAKGTGRRTEDGREVSWGTLRGCKATEITLIKCGEAIRAWGRIVVLFLTFLCVCLCVCLLLETHFHVVLPVTTTPWSIPGDSCECCKPASCQVSAGHSQSRPGRLRWSGCSSGHSRPAASAPLLRSSGCTPPIRPRTSWDDTRETRLSQQEAPQSLIIDFERLADGGIAAEDPLFPPVPSDFTCEVDFAQQYLLNV